MYEMTEATEAEKRRLSDTFVRLCETPSPSGRELEVARAVRAELERAGLEVTEDDTSAQTEAECGNLFATLRGPEGSRTIMLCAHLDTVPLAGDVEVELVDGVFRSRGDTILGADNKAAVAVLIEIARRYSATPPPVTCELVFTVSEETGLRGARALDPSRLKADFGFVMDHASPIGELIVAAPSYYQVTAHFTGTAAHAGIRPEQGRSAIVAAAKAIEAMKLGRLDEETTANVGRIEGGSAPNVVPERCELKAEVRSLDDARAVANVGEMVDALTWAASTTETDVDTEIEEQFRAYRIPESDPAVAVAQRALRDRGIEPVCKATGGGSDAHVFQAKGLRCLNMANGTEGNHTSDECVSAWALETMFDVTLSLLERSAEA